VNLKVISLSSFNLLGKLFLKSVKGLALLLQLMRIAVNIQGLVKNDSKSFEHFTNELMQHIVKAYPQHEFLFLSDKPLKHFSIDAGITILTPMVKGNASLKYWYDVKLVGAVKKLNADILVHFGETCSLTTKIPQVLVIKDLAFIHHPKWFSKPALLFNKIFQKKFIGKAKYIVALSEFVKQDINAQYKISAEKATAVLPAAGNSFKPISFEEREAIKDGYADGREFFLFIGSTDEHSNLMNVLKAFSIFKKWQQSSMKLLVTGKADDGFMEKLKTYKYRDDVTVLDTLNNEQYAKLVTAAYALICVPVYDGIGLPIVEAMQAGVPTIASEKTALSEMAADAALYVNPIEVDELANQMKILYRDEALRSQLIQKGLVQAAKFTWHESAERFMKIIESAAST